MGCSCKCLINISNRVTPKSASIIHHIYTSLLDKLLFTSVAVTDISDHYPTFCIIPLDKSNLKQQEKSLFAI